MASFMSRMAALMSGVPIPKASPYSEAGVSGTAVFGGYIANKEKSHKLFGQERYRVASDTLVNISIVAAGIRYFLNLLAKPEWKVEPADDSDEAQRMADFVEEVMGDMVTAWPRLIRRCGMYRYYGFGIQEWTAKKRDDGLIGYEDIESRPQHTIERWSVDERGTVLGVWQRSPQTGQFLGIPIGKCVYLIDDTLTDSPEGIGWFRHLIEPGERLRTYLQLEGYGFQRDLSGTPIGRAPLTAINEAVKVGKLTRAEADKLIQGMEDFVKLQAKAPDSGMVLDSQPFQNLTADGLQVSAALQWGIELLTGQTSSLPQINLAIERVTLDMARIIGVEQLLLGANGKGSLALSKDKSEAMYLLIGSTLMDMTTTFSKDFINPLWTLNGFDDALKPKLVTEDVAFKDVAEITTALQAMSTAGAVLQPDDPVIDEVRDLMGLSHQPEVDPALIGAMNNSLIVDPNNPNPGNEPNNQVQPDGSADPGKPPPKKPFGKRRR